MPGAPLCFRELHVVVDLAVGDDVNGLALVGDGLVAGLQVDDRQPAHAQHGAVERTEAAAVRAAVAQPVGGSHGLGELPRIGFEDTGDAAHQ
jgi:hypothetical protein